MKKSFKIITLSVLSLFTQASFARNFEEISKCFEFADKSGSLLLRYNASDRYSRSIDSIRLPYSCSTTNVTRALSGLDLFPWKNLRDNANHMQLVNSKPKLKALVESIERGAHVIIPSGYTPKDYLREHPVTNYSKALNTELTKKFGVGFAGQVFREFLLAQPKNAAALTELENYFKEFRSKNSQVVSAQEIKKLSKGSVLLVSMGLDWDHHVNQHTPSYITAFLSKIREAGVEVQFLERDPVGLVEDNIRQITPQVEKILASGKNIILLGMCKGMPEVLAPVATTLRGKLDANRRQINIKGRGKVVGVIGISPMMGGLYLADTRDRYVVFDALEEVTSWIPDRRSDMASDYIRSMESMTSEKTDRLYAQINSSLPADVPYLGLAGIVPGDGLLKVNNSMKAFFDINRRLNLAAANDGLLEYPKMLFPLSYAQDQVFNVPVHASHMMVDGSLNAFSLQEPQNERALYYATLKFVLKRKK